MGSGLLDMYCLAHMKRGHQGLLAENSINKIKCLRGPPETPEMETAWYEPVAVSRKLCSQCSAKAGAS